MSARQFRAARTLGTAAPVVITPTYATGQTFVNGALVVMAAGEVSECGADPADIYGVALQAAATNPGYDAANSPTVVTGRQQTVSVALANDTTIFGGKLVNGSSTLVTPVAADIGAEYGVTKYGSIWYVDKNKTGASARVVIIDADLTGGTGDVFFQVLEANRQL